MKSLVTLLVFVVSLITTLNPMKVAAVSTSLLINEVKLGGTVSGQPTQFVELINISESEVDLAGWTLEYAKEGFSSAECTGVWEANDTGSNNTTVQLSGNLPGATTSTYSTALFEISLTDNKGGSLQLLDTENNNIDIVGWGEMAPCHEGDIAPIPGNGKSIERLLICDAEAVDTDDNKDDFAITTIPTPSTVGSLFLPSCASPEPTQTGYMGVHINELFPNPSSPSLDEEAEFVELYNPNDQPVSLEGYILQTGSSFQYEYILPNYVIAAKDYLVLYASETNLVLSNTSSTARIMSPDQTNMNTALAYDDVGENEAWALDDGQWQLTETPTPGAQNVIYIEAVISTSGGKGSGLEPCPSGKFRNPETNRCKNIESSTGLKPCEVGQTRNPATNRCRSLAVGATTLTPCKPGQERNKATNRCRKVAGAATSLVPCKVGYERNPETNRCRKATGTAAAALTNPAVTTTSVNYPVLALASILALGYGIYEYRQEIAVFLKKFSKQLLKK